MKDCDKKQDQTIVVKKGMGFCSTLTLMLIAFKILGISKLSWWWVLSPLWIPIGLLLLLILAPFVLFTGIIIFDMVCDWLEDRKDKEKYIKGRIIQIKRKEDSNGNKEREDN